MHPPDHVCIVLYMNTTAATAPAHTITVGRRQIACSCGTTWPAATAPSAVVDHLAAPAAHTYSHSTGYVRCTTGETTQTRAAQTAALAPGDRVLLPSAEAGVYLEREVLAAGPDGYSIVRVEFTDGGEPLRFKAYTELPRVVAGC